MRGFVSRCGTSSIAASLEVEESKLFLWPVYTAYDITQQQLENERIRAGHRKRRQKVGEPKGKC